MEVPAGAVILLSLLPIAIHASPLPLPTPTPFPLPIPPSLNPRNHAGPPANYTTDTAVLAAQQSATATSTSSAATSTSTGYDSGNLFSGIPSQLLQWVAVVIIAAVTLSLVVARYLYIRRFYPPTLRSYFLPQHGLHFPRLGIHIKAPPPRPVPPPSYTMATLNFPSSRFGGSSGRRRRDRTVVGQGIGDEGRRVGSRDQDDLVEGEEDIAAVDGVDDLPGYRVDRDLPGYDFTDGGAIPTAETSFAAAIAADRNGTRTAAGGARAGQQGEEGEEGERVLSATEYEEATRRARDAALPAAVPRARIREEVVRPGIAASTSRDSCAASTSTGESGETKVGEEEEGEEGKGKSVESLGEGVGDGEGAREEEMQEVRPEGTGTTTHSAHAP